MLLEYSWPSFSIIKNKLISFFKNEPFCIVAQGVKLEIPKDKKVHIVLFGDGILALQTLSQINTNKYYYIWVLSSSHALLLSRFHKIPIEHIGIIPRYELFSLGKYKKSNVKNYDKSFSLISSASISKNKNFEFCVKVMSHAQKVSIQNIECFVCGPNMEYDLNQVKNIVSKYVWKHEPKLLGDIGTNWADHDYRNPILLSFSTSIYEDYGVSIAQAQAKGWPVVISDWGGHRDVQGKYVIKIPYKWIENNEVTKVVRCLHQVTQSECFHKIKKTYPKMIHSSALKSMKNFNDLQNHCYGIKKKKHFEKTITKILGDNS